MVEAIVLADRLEVPAILIPATTAWCGGPPGFQTAQSPLQRAAEDGTSGIKPRRGIFTQSARVLSARRGSVILYAEI